MKTLWLSLGINFLICLILSNNLIARDFKNCTELKDTCFEIQNSPQKSFYMGGTDTNKVAVLVHGLSDSAYFTKDLALLLNSQGYYIYSVLLTGHGLKPEALLNVQAEDWIKDVKETMEQAMAETGAHQIVLSGFSMGGVLVTSFAEDPQWKAKISKIILMAPAFKLNSTYAEPICFVGGEHFKTWASNNPGSSRIKYSKLALHAVCELVSMSSDVRDLADTVTVPVFMVVTDYDQTINTTAAIDIFSNMSSRDNKLFYIQNHKTSHTDINFKSDKIGNRKNPLFDEMSKRIIQFLNKK